MTSILQTKGRASEPAAGHSVKKIQPGDRRSMAGGAQRTARPTLALGEQDKLRTIEWRDLVALSLIEKGWELGLGLPWLILS